MIKYSFCILKKDKNENIIEKEFKEDNSFIEIKYKRTICNKIKEYYIAKAIYDNYGIKEYYENLFWEYEDKIILFSEEEYNIKDFCEVMKKILDFKLRIQKVNLNNLIQNQKENKLKIKNVFIQSKEDNFIEETKENEISLTKKYYKIELVVTLNKIITFVEIIKESIFRLAYRIKEREFINIVEELDLIYGECNNKFIWE